MHISIQVFGSNHAEKIFRIFTFEDLIKNTGGDLEETPLPIPDRIFLLTYPFCFY